MSPIGRRRRPRSSQCRQQPSPRYIICRKPTKLSICAVVFLLLQGSSASSPNTNNHNNPLPKTNNNNPLESSSTLLASNPLVSNPSASVTHPVKASNSPAATEDPDDHLAEQQRQAKKKERKKKKRKGTLPDKTSKKGHKTLSSTRTSTAPASSSSSSSSLSSAQSVFVRRIQREWKDAVTMGIAYDWVNQKPIRRSKKKHKKETSVTRDTTTEAIEEGGSIEDSTTPQTNNTDDSIHLCLGPLGSNLFVWHFSILGLEGSQYEGGVYHGRLILPPQYPASPPRVQVWTPSGRFVPLADICLSASAFHPETWKPSAWNLRTIIESLRLHFITPAIEIGGMSKPPEERQELAIKSRTWKQSFMVAASKKKATERIVTIDHAKMIRQGLFVPLSSSAANPSLDEEMAIDSSEDPVNKPEEEEGCIVDMQENEQASLPKFAQSSLEQEVIAPPVATKTKKRRRSKRKAVRVQERPSDQVAASIKRLLNNRNVRLALILLCIYMLLFGVH